MIRRVLSFAADFAIELVHEQLVAIGRRKLGIAAMEERIRELEAQVGERQVRSGSVRRAA